MNHNSKNQFKMGSSIQISSHDRKPSKKFTTINQNNRTGSSTTTLLNSFQDQLNINNANGNHHLRPNPMSLVPSPSRGMSHEPEHLQKLDLTNHDFQLRYFAEWIQPKISAHRHSFPNQLAINIQRSRFVPTNTPDNSITDQLTSLGTLLREIRKLREGILASHRTDEFAIQIYELSAELALESCDFQQLNSLLPHLIFKLYKSVPLSASRSQNTSTSDDQDLQDQQDRRLVFTCVLLLIPICTRLSLGQFLHTFQEIPLPHHSICNPSTHSTRVANTIKIYTSLNRKNWVQFNRITTPLLSNLTNRLETHQNSQIDWDSVLLLHAQKLVREQIVWNSLRLSHYSISDLNYLLKSLSFDTSHQLEDWLKLNNVYRFQNGKINFKT
ncbi:uncharacterized protein MELLADRAFT_112605 [Melampsora larici-populina 98AG31]|uniref:Uncharacterized protein n=1 Tax=Melampsora larici-populina (strain 98AG31 / pathotype 3-4-7) TaxID=747676 RepID=F4S708_MELLP|nr:uncharacterized protein MELLADRAFT_112605 [Melampsora larici-populina 98AG31]EGF99553.1 hypothetical protein MELLADRAFT_112605 [Melampsora larici-populina 98AG31]